jgi:hypothetical protein
MRAVSDPNIVQPNTVMIRDGLLISNPGTENKVPAFDFKLYVGDCVTVGAQTDNHDLSRWGTLVCGSAASQLNVNNVCWGCHAGGTIKYYREPTLTVKLLKIADPSTDADITSVPVGGTDPSVRYKVEFTAAGPPNHVYVRTHPSLAKAENAPTFSPVWSTLLPGAANVQIGTYVWATDILPTAWDKTIPSSATPGTGAARVMIPLGMYNQSGGTLLDYDYGPAPGTGNPAPLPTDYYYFDLTP